MKSKNKSGKKPNSQTELSISNEKCLHKTSQLCGSLKQSRVIAKKPKKVQTNLKKLELIKKVEQPKTSKK